MHVFQSNLFTLLYAVTARVPFSFSFVHLGFWLGLPGLTAGEQRAWQLVRSHVLPWT